MNTLSKLLGAIATLSSSRISFIQLLLFILLEKVEVNC